MKLAKILKQLAQIDVFHHMAAIFGLGMHIKHSNANVENAVATGKNPAVAGPQLAMPDNFHLGDALAHGIVLHIATQRNATRNLALAHLSRQQCLGDCATGQNHPAGRNLARHTGT